MYLLQLHSLPRINEHIAKYFRIVENFFFWNCFNIWKQPHDTISLKLLEIYCCFQLKYQMKQQEIQPNWTGFPHLQVEGATVFTAQLPHRLKVNWPLIHLSLCLQLARLLTTICNLRWRQRDWCKILWMEL